MKTTTKAKEQKLVAKEKHTSIGAKNLGAKNLDAKKAPPVSQEQIRERAHYLWQQQGSTNGNAFEHWLRAEKELLQENSGT